MAKVRLDIETDLSPVNSAFAEVNNNLSAVQNEAKAFGTESKKVFVGAASGVKEFEKEVGKGADELGRLGKAADGLNKAPRAVKSMASEVKKLREEAIKLRAQGDLVGAEKAIKQAAELKDQIDDVREAVSVLAGNANQNLAKGFGSATRLASQGFEGVFAIQSLVGEENENMMKQLVRLQAIQSISRIAGEFADWKDRVTEIKLALTPITSLYRNANSALKNFGKVGVEATAAVAGTSKGFIKGFATDIKGMVTGGIASFKSLWATIAANPLGILLTVVGAAIAFFVAFREKIADLFGPLRVVFEQLGLVEGRIEKNTRKVIAQIERQKQAVTDRYELEKSLAEATGRATFAIAKKQTDDLIDLNQKAINEALKLAEKQAKGGSILAAFGLGGFASKGLQTDLLEKITELSRENKKLRDAQLVSDGKLNSEREKLEKDFLDRISEIRISGIKDDEQRERAMAVKKFNDDLNAVRENAAMLFETEAEVSNAIAPMRAALHTRLNNELNAISEKFAKERKDKLLALEKEFTDALKEIMKQRESAELNNLHGEARIQKETEIQLRELGLLKDNLIQRGQLLEDFQAQVEHREAKQFKLSADQLSQFAVLEAQIYQTRTDRLVALAAERQRKLAESSLSELQVTSETLDASEAGEISGVNLQAKPKSASEEDFELAKQKAILEIQRDYAKKRIDLKMQILQTERDVEVAGYNAELNELRNRNDAEATARKAHLDTLLALGDEKFDAEKSKLEGELAELINTLNDKSDELNRKKPFDLLKFLGITQEELQGLQMATSQIKDSFSELLSVQQQIIDRQIAESEKLINASRQRQSEAEREVDNLENQLEREQELRDHGKANNTDRIRAEIAEAEEKAAAEKKVQEQELEVKRQLFEEKKKLQLAQMTADTIMQTSNLITAASNIFATMAKDPVSTGIAIALISTMFGAFAAAKIKAFELAAKEQPGFKKGVIDLQGPGTGTSDSIPSRLSKGESVMTAKETKEHKKLFQGIRSNDRDKLRHGVMHILSKDMSLLKSIIGTSIPVNLPSELSAKRENTDYSMVFNVDKLQKEQQQTNRILEEMRRNRPETVYTYADKTVIKKGSHTTIIRK